jgi:hypothetical protein
MFDLTGGCGAALLPEARHRLAIRQALYSTLCKDLFFFLSFQGRKKKRKEKKTLGPWDIVVIKAVSPLEI